jgi:hypothetical protein
LQSKPYDENRPTIVVCDPVNAMHPKHWPHFTQWYAQNWEKHNLVLHMEMQKALHKVQASACEVAKEMNASHVLFTEHDQWAYPVDGLEVLLDQDKDVIGLPTYMRAYPYLPMCMKKNNSEISFVTTERNLRSFYPAEPIMETDLITWAFTLVKTDVLRRMEAEGRNPWVWDSVPTDSHFCQHCEEMDIKRYICAAYFVNHGDLPKEHVQFYRRMYDSILASQSCYPQGTLPPEQEIVDATESDPHGVERYKTPLQLVREKKAAG